jgi:hypothetical protein
MVEKGSVEKEGRVEEENEGSSAGFAALGHLP